MVRGLQSNFGPAGATRDDAGQVTGLNTGQGSFSFDYNQQGQLNQVVDPAGVTWNRGQNGWQGSNGQTRADMTLENGHFSSVSKTPWGSEQMERYSLKDGSRTDWTREAGDPQFQRDLANGNTQHLYGDGSTIDRDHYGRIQDFNGTGGMLGEIDSISKMTDPVQRNLQITQMYNDISNMMNRAIPGGGANWNTWATHASAEAGSAIRGEKLPQGYSDTLDAVHKTTRMAIGRGNNQVFTEIAPEMTKFLDTIKGGPDQAKMDQFKAGLSAKPALQNAFQDYYDAKFNSKTYGDRRAHMLKGNIRVGLHEQLNLDKMIDLAMPSGTRTLGTQTMSLPLPSGDVSLGKAGDWTHFPSRMEFIQNLFTSKHMDAGLFQSPFRGVESADIINGHVPRRFQ